MNCQTVTVRRLAAGQRAAMRELLSRHFEGVTEDGFSRDLSDKSHAILLLDDAGKLAGFSTMAFDIVRHGPLHTAVVYSGDTIVDNPSRNTANLFREWIHACYAWHGEHGGGLPLHWLLIASGARTFRIMPTFFARCFPRDSSRDVHGLKPLRNALAAHRYGVRFDPESGIVRLDHPQVLRPGSHAGRPGDGDAIDGLFQALNPGHVDGDELACVADIGRGNLTRLGRRMAGG